MNLKTLDDLWNNQLTIRPGHRYDLRSFNDVGVNNPGAYQIDRVCYASWYVPYVNNGTPNAQTFRRNGYELAGLYGYSNGLVAVSYTHLDVYKRQWMMIAQRMLLT